MRVRIYQPTKTAMQSGRAKTKFWVLEYVTDRQSNIDPLMGWIGGKAGVGQIKMRFSSKEEAIKYAKSKGLEYNIVEPKARKTIIKNYADNFKYIPK